MTNIKSTVQRNLQGFANQKQDCCTTSCPENRLVCMEIGQKNYIVEVDSCGNQVGDAKPMGACSVDENGALYPFDANGNQIIELSDQAEFSEDNDFWYITDPVTGITVEVCKNPVKSVGGVTPDGNGDVPHDIATFVNTGPGEWTYTNEFGVPTTFNINEIDMDINSVTQSGSVVTFTAEDGSSVAVDICAIVAAGCNSPMVINPDGSITYTDNAGNTTTINASNVTVNPPGVGGGPGTATITQTDGSVKDDVVCGGQSSVTPNTAGVGGGVGTATILQNDGSVKDDAVCGVQSTVVEAPDGLTATMTQNDGSTKDVLCAGNDSIVPNAAGVGGGTGTSTITMPGGDVKDDAVCGVQSTVVEAADGLTATMTQNDGSTKEVLCAGNDSIVENAAGEGGGVGTSTITLPGGDVKDDAVCGVQSTVVPSEDGLTATFTQNDGSTHEALCAGNDSIVENAEGVGGGVGTSTITLPGGDVKDDAVCGVQSTVTPSEDGNTASILQNDGTTHDVLCAIEDGGSNLVAEDGVTINPLLDKNGDPIDVTAESFLINSNFANGPRESGDRTMVIAADGSCKTRPMDAIVDNADTTATVTINGEACDLSTLRLDDTDPCYHYLVDTKTGNVVSSWCVEDIATSFEQEYNFTADLIADLQAAGFTGTGANIDLATVNNIVDVGWTEFGPYQMVVTNPSECGKMTCDINARYGAWTLSGAAGAFRVSMLGNQGLNSPTFTLDIGKSQYAVPADRQCGASNSTASSATTRCLNPGQGVTYNFTIRLKKLDEFIPTDVQVETGGPVLGMDAHKITAHCVSAKSRVGA